LPLVFVFSSRDNYLGNRKINKIIKGSKRVGSGGQELCYEQKEMWVRNWEKI